MASNTDLIMEITNGGRPVPSLLATPKEIGATSIALTTATGWESTTAVPFILYELDADGTKKVETQTDWVGVVSGSNITDMVLTAGTDQRYPAESAVICAPTAEWADRLARALKAHLNQNGTLKDNAIHAASVIASGVVTPTKLESTFAGGWIKDLLPTVSNVVSEGRGVYSLTFASSVASLLSSGMLLRSTRTAAEPIKSTLFDGAGKYLSKASPSKMTFTDDFTVFARIWIDKYPLSTGTPYTIMGRYSGSSGWRLDVSKGGGIRLIGYNGSGANYRMVYSTGSVPTGRWVDVAAVLDMSAYNTTECRVSIDGEPQYCGLSSNGTNPTSLVNAGDFHIGQLPTVIERFEGKIAQVGIFNAKLTDAQIMALSSNSLTGTESNLVSGYSLSNSLVDLNTTTPNNLTANGGINTNNASSPFGNDGVSETLDYSRVISVSGSTARIKVPHGCTFPTSAKLQSLEFSLQANPVGFPNRGKKFFYQRTRSLASNSASAWSDINGVRAIINSDGKTDYELTVELHRVQNTTGATQEVNLRIMNATTSTALAGVSTFSVINNASTSGSPLTVVVTPPEGETTYQLQQLCSIAHANLILAQEDYGAIITAKEV